VTFEPLPAAHSVFACWWHGNVRVQTSGGFGTSKPTVIVAPARANLVRLQGFHATFWFDDEVEDLAYF